MPKLLTGIVMCAALVTSACNQPAEPLPELSSNPSVSVRSVKVTGSMPRADALAGLKEALLYVQQAAKQSEAEGKTPSGSFEASFQTEPDGMIRMLLEGENRLAGGKPAGVVEEFSASTMGNQWRFPASGGPSLIEAEFEIGQP